MFRFFGLVAAFSLVVLILLPFLLVRGCEFIAPQRADLGPSIKVYNHRTGELMELPLEEYLKGVVAAEMPASFQLEALKAQAVVARTFAAKRLASFGGRGCELHPGADVCTDPRHCQAWIPVNEAFVRWGYIDFLRYWRKISLAVDSTRELVVTYKGQLVDTPYHSCCGGSTENSEEVWSVRLPHLRSVKCEFCREAPNFRTTEAFTLAQLEDRFDTRTTQSRITTQRVGGKAVKVISQEQMERPLEAISLSSSGRVRRIKVGTRVIPAGEFRDTLGLRSTRFTWRIAGDRVYITTQGYGHGVGMCQYGADGLARQGKGFEEIMKYYYQGVELYRIETHTPS